MALASKYSGSICKRCSQKIIKGQMIIKDDELNTWVHEVCPAEKKSASEALSLAGRNQPVAVQDEMSMMPVKIDWIPSKYQQDIFDAFEKGLQNNIVVEAVAGSGKSTTILRALSFIKNKSQACVLAFNKHIAKEFKSRAPEGVHVSTMHSLGLKIVKKLKDFKEIEEDKLDRILEKYYPVAKDNVSDDKQRSSNYINRFVLRRIVALCKATLIDYNNKQNVLDMCEHYGIDLETDERVNINSILETLPKVMNDCLEQIETIDFDDMIWLPVVHPRLRNHFEKYLYILVDEAQDLNNCQIEFLKLMCWKESKIVCVGDRFQSLYGFRGADTEAIPRLIKELNAQTLPLSITYRCPKSHVELAKEIVPQIEASGTAKEGSVKDIEYGSFLKQINPGDMVICRTNAPLVKPAFEAIRQGKKAIIRGKDIGGQLVNFVERFQATELSALEVSMMEFTSKEVNKLMDKGKVVQAELVEDKTKTILEISKECKSVAELKQKLQMLFSDSNVGVVFSSIHRAKGLEANRVFILKPDLLPHPKAQQEWEKVQEMNTKYVALTRSKDELYFVHGNKMNYDTNSEG